MADGAELRSYGRVFNQVADQYDRHRPSYPEALIDRACEVAALVPGDPVLEIGCGTGQLTRALLARGLRVTAVEPGAELIKRARDRLADSGGAKFICARFEDVVLPREDYRAVFAASAIHWIDPDVGWRGLSGALAGGGTLALISYFGCDDPRSAADQEALRAALHRVAPELAGEWPAYPSLWATVAGAEQRRGNISEAWSWLGGYELGRPYVPELFEEAEVATVPILVEQTAPELVALLATMSFWARLSTGQRDSLTEDVLALGERLDRPIRSSTVACLVTASSRPRSP